MKNAILLLLFFAFTGIQMGYAQMDIDKALKSFSQTKDKVDKLAGKYKPYKDLAVKNSGMLSKDLQKNLLGVDSQVARLSDKLDRFPTASAPEQIAMASSFATDYKDLKKSTSGAIKSVKKLKLPAMG